MGEPGAPQEQGQGGTKPNLCPREQEQPCGTHGMRVCGSAGGRGGHKQQSTAQRLKTQLGSERAKAAKDKSQRAYAGGAPGWASTPERAGKLLFREPSEAPSGKGSPGEGHLPPRHTQDVSSALSRTGCQRAGKAVLEGAEGSL